MSQRRRARVGTLKYTQVNMGGSRRVGLRGSLAGAACYSQAELLLAHKIGNLAEEEVAAAMRRTASRSSRVLLLLSPDSSPGFCTTTCLLSLYLCSLRPLRVRAFGSGLSIICTSARQFCSPLYGLLLLFRFRHVILGLLVCRL
jgi:hypothetical protein